MSGSYGYGAANLDTSLPLKAGQNQPAPFNPLATAGEIQGFQRNALAIQQQQQELASQNALGRAAQGAIRADGSFDGAAFATAVKNDPAATYGAVQGIQQGQTAAGNQYKLNADQLGQTNSRVASVGAGLSSLLSNPNVTRDDVINNVAGQFNAGRSIGEFAQSVLPSMPVQAQGESAPAFSSRLHGWLSGVAGQAAGPDVALRTFTPQVGTVGLGGTTQTMDTNPLTNPNATGTTFRNTLSPEGQASPVPGPVGPDGQETTIPRSAYAASNGLGGLVPGGSPFGTGRPGGLPSGLLNPNRAGAAGAGGASDFGSAGGNGGAGTSVVPMVTKLGPGQEAGMTAAGKASADQWGSLQQQVGGTAAGGGSAGRIYQLQSALGDLQRLGQTGSGPSATTLNTVKSYLNSIPGVGTYIPGFDPNGIANYDQANKALTNYASARAGAHGGTTDSQLATTLTGNASTHISNLAAVNVVKANIALERMDQAQAQAFQNATNPQTGQPLRPDQFATWSAGWNRDTDARAFMVDQLTPQQFQRTVAGMSPTDRARFQNTYNAAVRNGWVSPPAWAASSAPPAAGSATSDGQPSTADMAINPTGAGG